jgi:DNA polymerase III subunit delta'
VIIPGVFGNERAISRLWEALERDTLHHAYLFEGPDGVGKHLVATRLAMAANCVQGSPCGKCKTCLQIEKGHHPDVIALTPDAKDATATIKADAVREVVRKIGYHRYDAKRRVVIIDPAEAMQATAANSLLKTLEEPPDGTGFILIANHARALLPTIVSRCQRVRFGPVPETELAEWLRQRGVGKADLVARRAEGCPGRALTLSDKELNARGELRAEVLGVVGSDIEAMFKYSDKIGSAKGRPRQAVVRRVEAVLDVLGELLRDTSVRGSNANVVLLNDDAEQVVDSWSSKLWPDGVARLETALNEARDQLALNVSGRTVLDAVLASVRSELA